MSIDDESGDGGNSGPKLIDPRRRGQRLEATRVEPRPGLRASGERVPPPMPDFKRRSATDEIEETVQAEEPEMAVVADDGSAPKVESQPSREPTYRVDVMRAFRAQIAPHLSALAAFRRRGWINAVIAAATISLGVFVGVRVLGGTIGLPSMDLVAPVLALAIGLPVGYAFGNWWYTRSIRGKILPLLCESIGGVTYSGNKRRGFDIGSFRRLALLDPRLTLVRLEDRFSGTYRNTRFDMMEAVYQPGRRVKEEGNRFLRGVLIRLSVPMPFKGTTIVSAREDKPTLPRISRLIGRRRLRPVRFDDPVFELQYQTRSDDAEEAHRLVAPSFRDAMLAMTTERQGEMVRAAFHDDAFLLSVPVWQPLFEIASLMTPTRKLEERTLKAADEITVVHRVIDQLHGAGPQRLI